MPAKTIRTIRLQSHDIENGQFLRRLYDKTDLKRIANSQNYKGYSVRKVKEIVIQMKVEESLEELLAALK